MIFFHEILHTDAKWFCPKCDGARFSKPEPEEKEKEPKMIFVQYRGKVTDKFIESLNRLNAPCKIISTIKKLKTVLPPLKAATEKMLKSKVVYHIKCSRCDACYVGQTARHLITRFNEYTRNGPIASHIKHAIVLPWRTH